MMDELREKIIDAIGNTNIDNAFIKDIFDDSFIRKIADALIKAGIGNDSKYEKLAYEVRCNLTSITRYIHNKNRPYNKKYKELAENAVNNLLDLVNGEQDDKETRTIK